MTLRIDPDLLEQLKALARAERRSLSAQVLHLVRQQLGARHEHARPHLPTMGWLRHWDAPDEIEEFRRLRRELSAGLERRVRRHPKER